MPTYYARKAGNINAVDVWATAPGGTASAVTFASGDVLVSNSFAIAINVSTDLGGSGQLRNDTLGGATAGGTFTLAAGLTLTANILQNNVTGGATVVNCTFSAPLSASIVGNVTSPFNTSGSNRPVSLTGSGTLNFTGNATGDMKSSSLGGAIGNVGGGTINFVGTATGGGGTLGYALENASSGTINITGNCLGAVAPAVGNVSTGTINITGQAIGSTTTGGGAGVANTSTGAVFATRAVGGSFGPGSSSVTAAPGIANSSTGIVEIEQLQYGTLGMSPTSGGGIRLKKLGSNVAVFNYCDTAGAKTLIDATQNAAMPAASNVRSGVSYASGALTGSCAVPAAGSVALGVPVDATTGTAVLTPEAVWGHASRTITGGLVDTATTLTNSPDVPTEAEIASAVRTELDSNSTKLANLDATISSRSTLTTGDLPSVPSAASVASAVRTELTELSNLDASVSSRLAGSAYTAPSTPPTAAAVASAVRTELTELSNLDASVSSRLASASYTAPANSDISAIKSKTDNLPASPAAVSDIPTTAQISAAVEGSLLNESDGQQILNAIVGAIGNTNLSEVSLVAAIRSDLERTGGKIDSIPTDSAPSAASVATAVWSASTKEITGGTVTTLTNSPDVPTEAEIASQVRTELSLELGRIDAAISSRLAPSGTLATVTTLTNAPTVPTAAAIADEVRVELATELARLDAPVSGATAPSAATVATAVRSELATELARVDQAVSSRLAGSAYTAPANSDVAAIKAKTDALNTERLANVATTAIVGNLLAQANS